jgi:hypothetical protein
MRRKQFPFMSGTNEPILRADMRGSQFSSLLAAGFRVGLAYNMLTYSNVLFPLHFPLRSFVLSRNNGILQFETELCSCVNTAILTQWLLTARLYSLAIFPASSVIKR